jgi:hypothetical protein
MEHQEDQERKEDRDRNEKDDGDRLGFRAIHAIQHAGTEAQ